MFAGEILKKKKLTSEEKVQNASLMLDVMKLFKNK
jgi:hypothetical protein